MRGIYYSDKTALLFMQIEAQCTSVAYPTLVTWR
jgi:hypothetical protein